MGFARYAPKDMEILGQQVHKGQMVLMMPHLKDHNPEYYENPERFDVERTFNPDVQIMASGCMPLLRSSLTLC